jgi:hypothetical protein
MVTLFEPWFTIIARAGPVRVVVELTVTVADP